MNAVGLQNRYEEKEIFTVEKLKEILKQAILEEVYTTPKPGLVDLDDNGAHRDMDVHTFEASTEAIVPWLAKMYETGAEWTGTPEKLFEVIRSAGKKAEAAMFAATKDVNTHKGLIFIMGILAASAGFCGQRDGEFNSDEILKFAARMTAKPLEKEFREMETREPVTNGEKLYARFREKGVRGQAQTGFPVIRESALPLMRRYLAMGADKNRTNLCVLLRIITRVTDTNVWGRSSFEEVKWLQNESDRIMQHGGAFTQTGMAALRHLNTRCIYKNISPGGAADLLAATIFLYNLEQYGL